MLHYDNILELIIMYNELVVFSKKSFFFLFFVRFAAVLFVIKLIRLQVLSLFRIYVYTYISVYLFIYSLNKEFWLLKNL